MIIIMEPKATVEQINAVKRYMEAKGFKIVFKPWRCNDRSGCNRR